MMTVPANVSQRLAVNPQGILMREAFGLENDFDLLCDHLMPAGAGKIRIRRRHGELITLRAQATGRSASWHPKRYDFR